MEKALIIEDDAANRCMVKEILEAEGFTVITSASVLRIEKIVDLNPDVILMDIWIGGQYGGDLCRELKSSELTNHIPVILISGISGIAEIAKENKADFYIAKPYDLDVLIKMVYQVTRSIMGESFKNA